ncbi:glycosyltransferase [Deinococcus sp. RIT780]|uniref:glycosyltransferase n=1 Tax=Deinococcus sp. RIT780 TaxID=2870472 RepID=UPI001C8A1E5B|nr:glycosyltransferase [Deinococcus sp. RIT780]MBX8465570.1 glycosyltransferase [Deinococcus sp. RIT780]
MKENMRVVIVTNIASPYRIPTWGEVAKRVERLTVLLCNEMDSNRIWKLPESTEFEIKVLKGKSIYLNKFDTGFYLNRSILSDLIRLKPEAIVLGGYESPTYLMTIIYARLTKTPLILWWGSHALSQHIRNPLFSFIKQKIFRYFDAFVTYGSLASESLAQNGVSRGKIVTSVNTVNTSIFFNDGSRHKSGAIRFLFVGQLIDRKGILDLVDAFKDIENAELYIIGHGELELQVNRLISKMPNIHYIGKTGSESTLAEYYRKFDCLVVPSKREVWGLVVNEAMLSGLPVIASDRVGAAYDLVLRAPTFAGLIYEHSSKDSLINSIELVKNLYREGKIANSEIAEWASRFSPEGYAEDIIRAINIAKNHDAKS